MPPIIFHSNVESLFSSFLIEELHHPKERNPPSFSQQTSVPYTDCVGKTTPHLAGGHF